MKGDVMAVYGLEKKAYVNDVDTMEREPSLQQRLEEIRRALLSTMGTLSELQHGPSPEKDPGQSMPQGVLNLGAECDKLANLVASEVVTVAKRIGRL